MKGCACFSILALSLAITSGSFAKPANEARVAYVTKDVRFQMPQSASLRVSAGDIVRGGTTIENGAKARSELVFGNQTVARLGANTSLQLNDEPAAMELREGAMLFQIPKGGTAKVKTAGITASSAGATGIVERHGNFYIKFLLLEGEARLTMTDRVGESILLQPGQILITSPKATMLPESAYFDIARVTRTCRLISDFPSLRSQQLVSLEAQKQARLTSNGTYVPSNLVIFGRGTLVNLVPPQAADNLARKDSSTSQSTH